MAAMELGVPMGGHRVGGPHCYPCVVCGVPILCSWGHWMALGSPLAAMDLGVPVDGHGMGLGSPLTAMELGVPIGGHRVGGPHWQPWDGLGVPMGGHWMGWGCPYGVMGRVGGPH